MNVPSRSAINDAINDVMEEADITSRMATAVYNEVIDTPPCDHGVTTWNIRVESRHPGGDPQLSVLSCDTCKVRTVGWAQWRTGFTPTVRSLHATDLRSLHATDLRTWLDKQGRPERDADYQVDGDVVVWLPAYLDSLTTLVREAMVEMDNGGIEP